MQLNPIQFDYTKSALIKNPFEDERDGIQGIQSNREIKLKTTRVVVDSRDRDITIYPTPTKYEVVLVDDIEEVTSAELMLADIPLSGYNITKFNNTLCIEIANTQVTIQLTPGNYGSGETLRTQLLNALITQSPSPLWEVEYNSILDKVIIKCNLPFTVVPCSNSIYKVLGVTTPSTTTYNALLDLYVLEPTYRFNLFDNRHIIMNIEQITLNNSSNPVLHKSFVILGQTMASLNFINAPAKVIKYFNPPIARLTKLRISFTDYYGNPYDFQNHDHRIEIIFESRKHLARFTR